MQPPRKQRVFFFLNSHKAIALAVSLNALVFVNNDRATSGTLSVLV